MFAPLRSGGAEGGLSVVVLRDAAELELLRGEWEDLLTRSAGLHPSLTPTWTLAWWRVFGHRDGRRLRALAVRDGWKLIGLLPLLERRHWHHGVVPMRRIELLASGEAREHEIVSEYLGPIAATGREPEVAAAIVDHLASERGTWEELVFTALDAQSPAVQALEATIRRRGFSCESKPFGQCPFVALPKRWEDYVTALSSDKRHLVKRSLRDFERWAGPSAKVEVARSRADLQRGRTILHQLHAQRWQIQGQEGAFASPVFRYFHDLVMPALIDRGELDLRWLVANGLPVAVNYSIVNDGRIYFYQGGRSTDVPKGVRPGIVLHLYAIKAAIEAGQREYDFLAGDMRYKLDLATATRSLIELRVTRPSLAEVARIALIEGRAVARKARARAKAEWIRLRPVVASESTSGT